MPSERYGANGSVAMDPMFFSATVIERFVKVLGLTYLNSVEKTELDYC
jgi:hypothetical protein